MRLFVLPLLFFVSLLGFGQDGSEKDLPARDRVAGTVRDASARTDTPVVAVGDVTIEQDERIAKLMGQYAAHKHPLKGFRVQIFLGSDRDKAREMRRSFLVKHPDVGGYESYLAPNFRIRVGDLRTRLEAEKLRDVLKAEYPGCYIVPDEIELPRIPDVK
ncbi:MAG: SPOR domain-containing protein [Flavobacteriales bacterium]|nr:MAG: SPOR domain-containing protein [Flavobacteriales bacterium]